MDKSHELVSALKQLSMQLGRTPNKHEFIEQTGFPNHLVDKYTYTAIQQMAGITPLRSQKKYKPGNEVFNRDLSTVLDEYIPREPISQPVWPKILILGDIHFPFHSKRALEKVYEFCREFQPEHIVQMGDLFDFLAHSKYPRSINNYSPQEEESIARESAEEMWKTLKSISPDAKCYQLVGNHDLRPLKRVLESAPQVEHWVQDYWSKLISFEGVETIYDGREELEIAGILFTHGFLGKEGAHRDYYLKNVVIGHLHKLWVQYRRIHGGQTFELCCGFLGEPESKALTYNNSKLANYQLGFACVDKYGPRAIYL